jgi:hypothetical protein
MKAAGFRTGKTHTRIVVCLDKNRCDAVKGSAATEGFIASFYFG